MSLAYMTLQLYKLCAQAQLCQLPCRKELVQQMTALAGHYIALAAVPVAKTQASMTFPSTFRRSTGSMHLVPVPSVAHPAQPDGDYSSLPHITGKLTDNHRRIAVVSQRVPSSLRPEIPAITR